MERKLKRYTFKELKDYAKSYWGLELTRGHKDNFGRLHGSWKTGFIIIGNYPGQKMNWYRCSTLKEVAKIINYPR